MKTTMMMVENETSCPFHTRLVAWEREEREKEKEKQKYNIIRFFLARLHSIFSFHRLNAIAHSDESSSKQMMR
jgi:DNA-binding XRE family transcriptional regulator